MNTATILYEEKQSEPVTNMVENISVNDGPELSVTQQFSWEDLRGLCWVGDEDW